MNWVKIEQGCEMPEEGELILIAFIDGDDEKSAVTGGFSFNGWYACTGRIQFGDDKSWQQIPTHWARLELPNN